MRVRALYKHIEDQQAAASYKWLLAPDTKRLQGLALSRRSLTQHTLRHASQETLIQALVVYA